MVWENALVSQWGSRPGGDAVCALSREEEGGMGSEEEFSLTCCNILSTELEGSWKQFGGGWGGCKVNSGRRWQE